MGSLRWHGAQRPGEIWNCVAPFLCLYPCPCQYFPFICSSFHEALEKPCQSSSGFLHERDIFGDMKRRERLCSIQGRLEFSPVPCLLFLFISYHLSLGLWAPPFTPPLLLLYECMLVTPSQIWPQSYFLLSSSLENERTMQVWTFSESGFWERNNWKATSFEFMSLDWISIVVNSYSAIHLPLLLGATHYVYTTWVFVWIVSQILFVNLNVNFALY